MINIQLASVHEILQNFKEFISVDILQTIIQNTIMGITKQVIFILLIIIVQSPSGNVDNCDEQKTGDPTKCQTCQSGYNQVNWSCCINSKQHCSSCFTTSYRCDSCESNTYCLGVNGFCPTCESRMDYCATCTDCNTCLTCNSNEYTISSDRCVTCTSLMSNCKTCSSNSTCTNCVDNSTALNGSSCISCSILLANCSQCTSSITCIACVNNNYGLNSTQCQICSNLLPNCLSCNSSTKCTECVNKNFVVNTTTNQCVYCSSFMASCAMCNTTTVCILCEVNPNIVLSNSTCVSCISIIPNCLNCTTTAICTVCSSKYVLDNVSPSAVNCFSCRVAMTYCIKCSSKTVCSQCRYGVIVMNGCSTTPGCISVRQTSYLPTCIACNSTYFYPNVANGSCVCLKGHLAGQYCTQIIGCTNVVRSQGNYCTICNRPLHFLLANGTCICQPFYSLSGSQCTQICGDGKLFELPCDDGNSVNGDGCSAACQIQTSFICINGTSTSPSLCTYYGKVTLQLVCIQKLEDNTANIILKINPYISTLMKSNFNLSFYSYKNCSKTSHQAIEGKINLFIKYLQDVQGTQALISIQYDPLYIVSPSYSINVKLTQCDGNKLIYDPNSSNKNSLLFQSVVQALTALILIVWIVGSYSHKMIGVQTLHTFHLIFMSQAFSVSYAPVVIYFKGFHNTLNIYQRSVTDQQTLSARPYSRLYYSSDIVYNQSVVIVCELIALIIYLSVSFYNRIHQTIKKQKNKQPDDKFNRFKIFLYDFLVFPLFIGFFFNFFISLLIYSQNIFLKHNKNLRMQIFTIIASILVTAFIYFSEWKQILLNKKGQNRHYNKNYIPTYLTYIFVLSIFIQASLASLISMPVFVLLAFILIYTLFLVIYRPYQSCIHNIGVIVNQFGVIINLSWLVMQNFVYLKRQTEELVAFVLIIWMVLILIVAIIRIVYQLRQKGSKLEKKEDFTSNHKFLKFEQENEIMKSIRKQALVKINRYRVTSQIEQQRQLLQYQYNQQRNKKLELLNGLISFQDRISRKKGKKERKKLIDKEVTNNQWK